jgi:type IV pilus secretin PilQ/predicted competence protein
MRAKLAWALSVGVLAVQGVPARAQDHPAITDIRQESTDHSTRLIVECTGPVAYTYYSPDPLTVVVDLPEVDSSKIPARVNVASKEVESVRVTSMARADGRGITRLEVRLANLVPYQVFSKDKRLNLVFERASSQAKGPDAPEPARAPAEASLTAEAPVASAKPSSAAKAPAAPEPKLASAAETKTASAPEPKPVSAPEPKAAPAEVLKSAPATHILSIAQDKEEGQPGFTIKADGRLKYQEFFLGNPDRLVVDFSEVTSRAGIRSLDVAEGPVKKVRIAQFSATSPKVARLVLDLNARTAYRIVDGNDGIKILFGDGGRLPTPAPLAALKADPGAALAAPLPAGPAALPALEGNGLPVPVLPEPPQQSGPPIPTDFAAKTLGASTQKVYTGHTITLDFKDGDLQDIFRLFADISGLNVVVNPGVSGKVTLKLVDVPWDQALDLILKANGLGYTLEDNVIRIAKLSDLQREEAEKRKLDEEKALAGDLQTLRKPLSYAKATDVAPLIRRTILSQRGKLDLDSRTNTLIIEDLPSFIAKFRDLVTDLDRATPQVEIEARIVVTSRNFTRDIGIQWGFLNQQTSQFANTTGQTFPHAIILNGQAITSNQGLPADQGGLASGAGIGTSGRGYAVNLPASGVNSGIGISLGSILGNFNLDAALTALEKQGRGRILSTPKVTTQNNHAAEIKQGVQIPIQTFANNTVTTTFKDAVLTLRVTPQITEAGTVILDLEVENNSADFANEVQGIPPINTQSAKTNVLVRDGATAVIGGIYQSNEQTSQNETPFLSKIPILGYLFRERLVTTSNNELLLFITPRISKS